MEFSPKRKCLLTQTSHNMKVSCSALTALPHLPTAFVIRANRPTYSYVPARPISGNSPCRHGSFLAAVQDFHSNMIADDKKNIPQSSPQGVQNQIIHIKASDLRDKLNHFHSQT